MLYKVYICADKHDQINKIGNKYIILFFPLCRIFSLPSELMGYDFDPTTILFIDITSLIDIAIIRNMSLTQVDVNNRQ